MAKLAFLTFGILKKPWGDPTVAGFVERVPGNFAAAEASPGFVGRSGLGGMDWGEYVYPAFLPAEMHDRLVRTFSLWESLESVYAFAYSSNHAESLRHRREWMVEYPLSTYVAWWVSDGHQPTWAESSARLEQLHLQGATPSAFDFKTPFGYDGAAYALDRAQVKALLNPIA